MPFGVAAGRSAIHVQGAGRYRVRVGATAAALFTADGTGVGQLDARNADGVVNGQATPAAAGDLITVYVTGAGLMQPALADGALGPSDPPFPTPAQPVYVSVNGVAANVGAAVQAPGKVAGIVQVSFQLPAETVAGDAVVKVSSDPGNFPFQPRTTIAGSGSSH